MSTINSEKGEKTFTPKRVLYKDLCLSRRGFRPNSVGHRSLHVFCYGLILEVNIPLDAKLK